MGIVAVHLANYTLSFFMWMILGRGLLRLVAAGRPNLVTLAFTKVTEPVLGLTRRALPFVAERWVPAVTFFLLAAARVALIVIARPADGR